MIAVLQVAYLFLMPAFAFWLVRRSRVAAALGPVTFAYLFGILLAQVLPGASPAVAGHVRDLSIPLAIPLLLFGLDVRSWLSDARPAVLSFALCLAALLVMAVLAFALFSAAVPLAAEIAGMLTGMYSGGAPNMAVVHRVLEAPPELYLQVNAIDMASGAVYFLFLVTLAGPVYGLFLKPAVVHTGMAGASSPRATVAVDLRGLLLALGVALVIVGASVGFTWLAWQEMAVAPIMLGLTALAVAASCWPRLRAVRESYPAGYYLVNVFCCALGSQVDIAQLGEGLGAMVAMHMTILCGTIALHLLLAWLFRIDRDTAIITQTAALYGPPFVPPVAGALGNPALLLSGLTTGLVGYALGNYLGLAVATMLAR